jgi:hypothetical protein
MSFLKSIKLVLLILATVATGYFIYYIILNVFLAARDLKFGDNSDINLIFCIASFFWIVFFTVYFYTRRKKK